MRDHLLRLAHVARQDVAGFGDDFEGGTDFFEGEFAIGHCFFTLTVKWSGLHYNTFQSDEIQQMRGHGTTVSLPDSHETKP